MVIKGTPVDSSPEDPAYTSGDLITENAAMVDMPLYRVPIIGLNVQTLVPLYQIATIQGVLPTSGGTMTGAINTSGIILKQGVDYGDSLPSAVTPGKLFFKRVT